MSEMPERYRVMVLLASWCGLRLGELAELRRKDVDLTNGVLRVRRAVVRVGGTTLVATPKSDAGTRDVAIPPHLLPAIRTTTWPAASPAAVTGCCSPAADGTSHLARDAPTTSCPGTRRGWACRSAVPRDLRHTGAVLAGLDGRDARRADGPPGHSTPGAALRYQHAAEGRNTVIAKALSALVEARG